MCFDSEKPHIITEMTTTVGILKIIRKSCNKSIELIIRVIYLIVNGEAQKLAPILLVSNNTLRNILVFVLNLVFSLGKQ
jgi:hypothetical protein